MSSSVTWRGAEPSPQKANVGSMPPALKICGSALIPHSFSVNASSAFASLFIQQWEVTHPFKPRTTSMLGRVLPPLTSSWLQQSGDLSHHCSYLLRFGASPRLHAGSTAINRPVGVQPRNWGSSPRSGCFGTLPREARSLLGLAAPLRELGCFAASLPGAAYGPGRTVPKLRVRDHRSGS